MKSSKQIEAEVQEYYGKTLQTSSDLKTNACCTVIDYPKAIKDALSLIHDEVHAKYYGCGLTIPVQLENAHVLDLGCGAGRDCYALSKLVGENGRVVGIDMTQEQLAVANKHRDFHRQAFGHKSSNVSFLEGNIEKLMDLKLEKEKFDVAVSNCVINLANNKRAVLNGVFNLLKEGGELYFSDVYSDRRVPQELVNDKVLYGECLSGALYWNDFLTLAKEAGFHDPRVVDWAPITINNSQAKEKTGNINFYSVTYRLFKISTLESDCEEYGQAVIYKGSLRESPNQFVLDSHHIFEKGNVHKVCGNSWRMLHDTRFKEHFDFIGNFSTHYGIFEGCGGKAPFNNQSLSSGNSSATAAGCC